MELGARGPVRQLVAQRLCDVSGAVLAHVVAQLGRVEQAAVVEELRDELGAAHARVLVGEGQHGGGQGDGDHFEDGVAAEARGLAPPAPGDVGTDEERPPDAPEDPQEDEGPQLQQVPGRVELHVEEHQPAVAEGVDGAQGEGRHQGGEEGPPQGL